VRVVKRMTVTKSTIARQLKAKMRPIMKKMSRQENPK
jgi:hypothetical protein